LVKIYGIVTDFNGNPIEKSTVEIKNKHFETIYQTFTDAEGKYRLEVVEGTYIAMYICKDYLVKNLEYWAWNILAYRDLEINARIDGLEVYAINAWMPQGALPSIQIYFRPMSLRRVKELSKRLGIGFPPSQEELKSLKVIDIAPRLTKKDVTVTVDGYPVEILTLNKVEEAAGEDQVIFGYLIQTSLPGRWRNSDYSRICITVEDSETGEKGEGYLFWQKPNYV